MRLRIIKTSFTIENEWLFLLSDGSSKEYFIMNSEFYKTHRLNSPITKHELDYYDEGLWITATVEIIDNKRVVVGV